MIQKYCDAKLDIRLQAICTDSEEKVYASYFIEMEDGHSLAIVKRLSRDKRFYIGQVL